MRITYNGHKCTRRLNQTLHWLRNVRKANSQSVEFAYGNYPGYYCKKFKVGIVIQDTAANMLFDEQIDNKLTISHSECVHTTYRNK